MTAATPFRFIPTVQHSVLRPSACDAWRQGWVIAVDRPPDPVAQDFISDLFVLLGDPAVKFLSDPPASRLVNRYALQELIVVLGPAWDELTRRTRNNIVLAAEAASSLWSVLQQSTHLRVLMQLSDRLAQASAPERRRQIRANIRHLLREAFSALALDDADAERRPASAAESDAPSSRDASAAGEATSAADAPREAVISIEAVNEMVMIEATADDLTVPNVEIDAAAYLDESLSDAVAIRRADEAPPDQRADDYPAMDSMSLADVTDAAERMRRYRESLPDPETRQEQLAQLLYQMDAFFSERRSELIEAARERLTRAEQVSEVLRGWGIETSGALQTTPPLEAAAIAQHLLRERDMLKLLVSVGRAAAVIADAIEAPRQSLDGDLDYGSLGDVEPTDDLPAILAFSPDAIAPFALGSWGVWQEYAAAKIANYEHLGFTPQPRRDPLGGFIAAVDRSGSMKGRKSQIAYGFALALAQAATRAGFPFRLISFASAFDDRHIVDYHPDQKSRSDILREIMAWASIEPDGGTNFDEPLTAMIHSIEATDFRQGAIMITDGQSPVSAEVEARWQTLVNQGDVQLMGVIIGSGSHHTIERIASDVLTVSESVTHERLAQRFRDFIIAGATRRAGDSPPQPPRMGRTRS